MGHKKKRRNKRKYGKYRARSPSTSTSSSSESSDGGSTPPLPRKRKKVKVSQTNDATVSTNAPLHNMIPYFDPLTDDVMSWLKVIESHASTFSWTDSMTRYQALNKLKGSAKVWYDSLLRSNHTWTTWVWKDWMERLSNTFRVKRNMFDLLKNIIDCKPVENQSLYDFFFEQKSKIDSLCLNFSEGDVISIILGNIGDSNISASVEASNFKSCEDLAGFLHSRIHLTTKIAKPSNSINTTRETSAKMFPQATNTTQQTSGTNNVSSFSNIETNRRYYRKPIECFTCGGNHKRTDCTVKCEFCGKRGHTESTCFKKKSVRDNSGNTEKTVIQESKFIQSHNTKNNFCKKIFINDFCSDALIDTGSSCSIIASSLVVKQKMQRWPLTTPVTLHGFSKDSLKTVKEVVRVNLKLDFVEIKNVDLYILDDLSGCDILIGRNVTERPDLMYSRIGKNFTFQYAESFNDFCNVINESVKNFDADSHRHELLALFNEYRQCIATTIEQLGEVRGHEMRIRLNDEKPVQYRPYRTAHNDRQVIRDMVDELLENGIIRESSSPYASPALLVNKKNGEKRLCIDYRALNKITIKDKYPMPRIEDLIDRLQGCKFFTSLDLKSGYYQIKMAEESIQKTAFITEDGHYEFMRLPFGLANAPSCFQNMMNKVIGNLRFGKIIIYLDDILIISESAEENLVLLEKVLKIFKDNGLTLNLKKCHFLKTSIEFLGYKIDSEGLKPSENKIKAVREFPIPKTVHQLRQFLGLISYFRKFIRNCALLSSPLTKLLKKDQPWTWNSEHDLAFSTLKDSLTSQNVLTLFNPEKECVLYTDASREGLAGILMQVTDDGEKPIHYYSRQTTEDEKKYHSFELELLAVVQSLAKFRQYLLGTHFRLVTDCNAVRYALTKKDIIPRIARWVLSTQEFSYDIVHREGTRMQHVDALSRNPLQSGEKTETELIMSITEADWLLSVQLQDPELTKVRDILESGEAHKRKDIFDRYELLGNKVYRRTSQGRRWVVPKACIWQIIKCNHDDLGHFSVEKTVERISHRYWFPRMQHTVKKYIKNCINCVYYKNKGGPKEGELYPLPKYAQPFHTLHLDHLGPFVETQKKNKYLLVCVDAFTKFVFIAAVPSTDSNNVICELKKISKIFGNPRRFITDSGSAFTSKLFKDYCSSQNIRLHNIATGLPRANGQAERFNKTILDCMKTMGADLDEDSWDECITSLQQAINSTVHRTTKAVPSEVMFGYRLHTNSDSLGPEPDLDIEHSVDVTELRKSVDRHIKTDAESQKERFDHHRIKAKKYDVGELVLVKIQSQSNDGRSKKLMPVYKGPFQIKKYLGQDRYEVCDMRGSERSNRPYNGVAAVENIKPWIRIENWE